MDSDKQFIGIDLCQHVPCIYNETTLNSIGELKNMPAALLPYYPNEKSMFGPSVFNHRRGRGWDWPPEARINLANEPGKGCGRVPIIAAFAHLNQMEKSWGASNASTIEDFHWSPGVNKIFEKASELIVGSSYAFALNNAAQLASNPAQLALVIPDRLQEYSQDKLKKISNNRACNQASLKFIPRSMALAMRWVEEFYPKGLHGSKNGYVGHIRVCSFGLDEWTFYCVPLKIVNENSHRHLIPVFDPMASRHSLGLWGITYSCLSALVEMQKDNILDIWKNMITGTDLDDLLNMSTMDLEMHCSKLWGAAKDSKVNQRLLECISKIPHFKDVPPYFLSRQQLIAKVSETIKKQHQQLPSGAGNLMGIIVDGSLSQMPFQNRESIGNFISQIDLPEKPNNIIHQADLYQSRASEGAAYFGKRFASGLPTYQCTLIPIDIYCRTKSETGCEWIPLIKKDLTLDAGKSEDLRDVSGFSIAKGKEKLSLRLKRPRMESEEGEFDYREVSVQISKPNDDLRVKLRVKVKPGDGFAEVEVKSDNGEVLATLDWSTMKECDEPQPVKLGWLPNLNKITPYLPFWKDVMIAFREVEQIERRNTQKFEKAIKELLKTLKKNKKNKECAFESFGPVSSNGLPPGETHSLFDIQKLLVDLLQNPRKQITKANKAIEQCMGWLFLSAPESFKKEIRWRLSNYELNQIKSDTLNCIGKVFQDSGDIQLFYQVFQKKIRTDTEKPTYWIMALNNLVRFREEALNTCTASSEFLSEVIDWLNEILKSECRKEACQRNEILKSERRKEACQRKAIACIRAISYLLYRRKFETDFLSNQTQQFKDIEATLKEMLRLDTTLYKQNIIQKTLLFLQTEATEADANPIHVGDDDSNDEDDEDN
jgi:hypothetical protein